MSLKIEPPKEPAQWSDLSGKNRCSWAFGGNSYDKSEPAQECDCKQYQLNGVCEHGKQVRVEPAQEKPEQCTGSCKERTGLKNGGKETVSGRTVCHHPKGTCHYLGMTCEEANKPEQPEWEKGFEKWWNKFATAFFDLGTNDPDDVAHVRYAKDEVKSLLREKNAEVVKMLEYIEEHEIPSWEGYSTYIREQIEKYKSL